MAMLTRYDPFRDLFRLQDVLSRSFDDRLGSSNGESVGWAPACEIFEDSDGVTVTLPKKAEAKPRPIQVKVS
jgi:HSP20 family protein